MTRARLVLLGLLIVNLAGVQAAPLVWEMDGNSSPRLDSYGDPLPPGALARLGTVRLRHGQGVVYLAFLPDGKTLLTVEQNRTVRLWDTATGKELRSFGRMATAANTGMMGGGMAAGGGRAVFIGGPGGSVNAELSADGKTLATTGDGRAITLWDVATGKEVSQVRGAQLGMNSMGFSPDGKVLAATGFRSAITLWDAKTGKSLLELGKKDNNQNMFITISGGASSLRFSPDSKTLAAPATEFANRNVTAGIKLWDVATGKEKFHIKDRQMGMGMVAPQFSPDGKLLAVGSFDGTIRFIDTATGKELRQIKEKSFCQYTFSTDSKALVTRNPLDSNISFWDVQTAKLLRQLPLAGKKPGGMVFFGMGLDSSQIVFSPNGKLLALGGESHTIRLLDIATGKDIATPVGHHSGVESVQFAADGKSVTSRGEDGTLRQWDAASGKESRQLPTPANALAVALSADGRTMAAGEQNNTIRLVDTATNKELHKFDAPQVGFTAMAISPNSKLLAVRLQTEQAIRLIDIASGKDDRRLNVPVKSGEQNQMIMMPFLPHGGAAGLFFSADSTVLAACTRQNSLGLWHVATGKELPPIRLSEANMIQVATLSPDGRSAAIVAQDDTLSLFETATGEVRGHLGRKPRMAKGPQIMGNFAVGGVVMAGGMAGPVFSSYAQAPAHLAFSPDGRLLAQGRADQTIALWDVASGKELGQLQGHQGVIQSLAFAPDGRTLVSGSKDTTALVWDVAEFSHRLETVTKELPPQELEARWTDLGGTNAVKAYDASRALIAAAKLVVPFLRDHLHPAVALDTTRIDRLVAELDSNKFKIRQQASVDLEKLGELAAPALRKVLTGQPSPETRKRAEELLGKLSGKITLSGGPLQVVRAIEVLEKIGTADAQQVLQTLAAGAPGGLETQAAEEALNRLAR